MFKQFKAGMAVTSAVYLALGCCLVAWPDTSIRLCCCALGALLVFSGGMQVWRFLHREGHVFFFYLSLVCGIICAAAGLFLLLQPDVAVSIFPIMFGLFVIFDSVARFGSALDLRRAGYQRWWNFLLLSLLSVALGLFMVANPFGTVTAMVTAVGVILIIEGAVNLFSLLYSTVTVRHLEKVAARLAEEEAKRLAAQQEEEAKQLAAQQEEEAKQLAAQQAAEQPAQGEAPAQQPAEPTEEAPAPEQPV